MGWSTRNGGDRRFAARLLAVGEALYKLCRQHAVSAYPE
jgi:hypothetical protein